MKSIRLIWIGKTQEPFVQDGISVYLKKLSHYTKVDSEEVRPAKYGSGTADQWAPAGNEKFAEKIEF